MVFCFLRAPSRHAAYLLILGLVLATVPEVAAQDTDPASPQTTLTEPTVGVQGGRYGVGLASSWPAYGLSGTLQVSETLTAEALLGALGTVSNFGGRLWYRFNRNPNYDLYGYGALGVYRYRYTTFNASFNRVRATETVLGVGAGGGIEASLQKLFDDEDFPPIFINAEAGLAFAGFEYYNFSSFVFGSGIHYRFGAR